MLTDEPQSLRWYYTIRNCKNFGFAVHIIYQLLIKIMTIIENVKRLRIVLAIILLITSHGNAFFQELDNDNETGQKEQKKSISVLPIIMYDSDIGFGFGAKSVAKNFLSRDESFDLMLFASTKGEQQYVLAFSVPDFEIRQGMIYPLALDLKIEFDKLLKSNFFGIGNESKNNGYQFPRELLKFQIALSRAFTHRLVGELAFRYTHYSVYDYDTDWQTISDKTPGAGQTNINVFSTSFRYDTRDSWIHPRKGFKFELKVEQALKALTEDWDFNKVRLEFSIYQKLINQNHILAFRWWLQQVKGRAPYQELSRIGDSWTARGYKADRFLDNTMALTSIEYRFHIYKKLGGVLFADTGRVWPKVEKFNIKNWHGNWGAGFRYYLKNFVTRFDIGTSREGTRLFFNFGHVF
jgi:outer membrane protein assembly factor BamA